MLHKCGPTQQRRGYGALVAGPDPLDVGRSSICADEGGIRPLTVEPAFHQALGGRSAPGLFLVHNLTVE